MDATFTGRQLLPLDELLATNMSMRTCRIHTQWCPRPRARQWRRSSSPSCAQSDLTTSNPPGRPLLLAALGLLLLICFPNLLGMLCLWSFLALHSFSPRL